VTATAAQALAQATAQLRTANLPDPVRDARRLLAHAMGLAPDRLTLHLPDPLTPDAQTRLAAALSARAQHQPVSQIVGGRLFWGRWFTVTPDVLDPRPETETLIAAALEQPATRVLDLGTGSGCILLTLLAEWPAATGLGIDASVPALAVAHTNARALGLATRTTLQQGDWAAGLTGPFDLIVSNPPYIAADELAGLQRDVRDWEPALALSPGVDGLAAYRTLLPQLPRLLAPHGRVLLEIGATQGAGVAALADAAGLADVTVRRDLDGRDRVVCARKAAN
jgi:release factor glutamine methyltransferase